MWRFLDSLPLRLPDTERFLSALNAHASLFDPALPVTVARAPGRLDVMGGIADYSGSLVLELPLAVATFVAAQTDSDMQVSAYSLAASELGVEPSIHLPLSRLWPSGEPLSYASARELFQADPRRSWAAYVLGVLIVLGREKGLHLNHGLRLLIVSDVPAGKGVGSSAALEVAAMQAVCGLAGLQLDGRELARLCQKMENLVVGAPCGIMDQMTSACGTQDNLLALLCQPAELQPAVPVPAELEMWGIDSGIRHAVTSADYGSVRVGAFMGYRILAGLKVAPSDNGYVTVTDPHWHGYLANLSPSQWETLYRDHVPEALDGRAFLERYGGSTDTVTRIDPARVYTVRQPTAHPIYEHYRVQLFRALLQSQSLTPEHCILLGELMYQSHWSYGACGLGSEGTDHLVKLVQAAGPKLGLYGAKITGGGSGGTVAVLARRGSQSTVEGLAAEYTRQTGRDALVLNGSSPGAAQFGSHHLAFG